MADALCGPSNALQNFQKHTSVDRTLQQDRLISRQSPQQDFRSAQGQHAGAIDPEFEAFQAGHAPPQPEAFQRFPAQHAPPPSFAGPAGALPDWAADFQRLHVSSPSPLQQQHHFQAQAPRHNQTASWHQDFLQQQQASSPAPQMSAGPSRPMYSGGPMMGFGAGHFAHQQPFMAQQDMNAQQAKQTDPVFDDAAFDSAFDAAAAEILEAERAAEAEVPAMAQADQRPAMSKWEEELGIMLPPETDETLAYMKEHAFGEYCRHQMTEYLPRTGTRDASPVPDYSLASLYMNALEKLQSEAKLTDLSPDPLLERVLNEMPVQQEQSAEQQQPEQPNNDDEELARTAGQLVDSVSHDTSQKFVQSRFLALMRQLRDHEVRVDGDKIVEDLDLGRGGGDDGNMTMTGALQNDDHDIGELRA
ncbi:hypothetical protein GTA08_BOTSDO05152 [Neofusicoccum parvum]|uniref:Uncharacterized protein n=1 Tax=Neofusicoccum parvum TaxID=310453 RepID=A0ACB5RRE9_9PEZI|nr:hypothetical protein GTA08_BOTSDO05152 [Neofusicoccum parvum]